MIPLHCTSAEVLDQELPCVTPLISPCVDREPADALQVLIEIADNLGRPFSLGVRLYANMFADHMVLGIFTGLTKVIIPLAFLTLGSIVCVIQAMVFMILSMAYVRLATSHEH